MPEGKPTPCPAIENCELEVDRLHFEVFCSDRKFGDCRWRDCWYYQRYAEKRLPRDWMKELGKE